MGMDAIDSLGASAIQHNEGIVNSSNIFRKKKRDKNQQGCLTDSLIDQ